LLVQRLAFSSPGALAGPTEAARLRRWWDEYCETLIGVEIAVDPEMPFVTNMEYLQIGAVGLGRTAGSIERFYRGPKAVAREGVDRFNLSINRGVSNVQVAGPVWRAVSSPGSASFHDLAEAGGYDCPGGHRVSCLFLPRKPFLEVLRNAENLSGAIIPRENEPLRLLVNYIDGLHGAEGLSHPALLERAGQTLIDLAALALGADRDSEEMAKARGLRAARLDAALRLIRAEYSDPEISPAGVARRLGISTRYLHKLLHETGASFAERVRELRLEKALTLLRGETCAPRKVFEAAYDAGFSDLSHFNRVFRRRYGLTPTAARGRE
jgi:AraC-like DNA-binding protein